MRQTVLLCLTALGLALCATPAYGGVVVADTGSYRYVGGVAETNVVSATVTGTTFTLTDSAGLSIDIPSGAACNPPSAGGTQTTCTMPIGFKLELELEDLDDTASVDGEAFVHGGPGNDQLTGATGPQALFGGDGADVLSGGDDADILLGELGDDTIRGGAGGDDIMGGDGRDILDYSAATAAVTVTPEPATVDTDADGLPDAPANDGALGEGDGVADDIEEIVGSAHGDNLTAAAAGTALYGGGGNDVLVGLDGPDRLEGGAGTDSLQAAGGDDTLFADDGTRESVACGAGADTAELDAVDDAWADCETTRRSDAGRAAPATTATEPRATTTDPAPAIEPAGAVGASPAGGTVLITLPGGKAFPLNGREGIPAGAIVDTTRGRVVITAPADRGTPQSAEVTGGVFILRRTGGPRPYTDFVMHGGSFKGCPRAKARRSSRRVARAAAARKKKVVRKLWAKGHGRFRTRGRHAAALVRGTEWGVEDHCDGTLTRVRRGVVSVTPTRRGRTTLVTAGRSRFVRASR